MKRWHVLTPALALCLLVWAAPRPARSNVPLQYTFTNLGAPGPDSNMAQSINEAGQVAGTYNVDSWTKRGFRVQPLDTDGDGVPDTWYRDANKDGRNDLLEILPLPSGYYYSTANSINELGQVTGCALGTKTTQPQSAAVWGATGLPRILTVRGEKSEGMGINDHGDIVALNYTTDIADLWRLVNGSYVRTSLGTPPGAVSSRPYGINNALAVSGYVGPGGQARWTPEGGWLLLGLHGAGASRVNQAGQITGSFFAEKDARGNSIPHGFVWLPAPFGGLPAGGTDVHDSASGWTHSWLFDSREPVESQPLEAVGSAHDGNYPTRAILWSSGDGRMRDLNPLVVNLPAGWVVSSARAINNRGQIAGTASFNGKTYACVLNPVR